MPLPTTVAELCQQGFASSGCPTKAELANAINLMSCALNGVSGDTDTIVGDYVLVGTTDGMLNYEAPVLDLDGNPTGEVRTFDIPEPPAPATDHTEVTDGGSNLADNTDPDNIIINAIYKCVGGNRTEFDALTDNIMVSGIIEDDCSQRGMLQIKQNNDCSVTETRRNITEIWSSSILPANNIDINENTPLGPVATGEFSTNINTGPCGANIPIIVTPSLTQKSAGSGVVKTQWQYSLDGGATWTVISTNGAQEYSAESDQNFISESYQPSRAITPTVTGLQTITVRPVIIQNDLADGAEFTNGQINLYARRNQHRCCEV